MALKLLAREARWSLGAFSSPAKSKPENRIFVLKMGNKTSAETVSDNDNAVLTTVESLKDISSENGAGAGTVQPAEEKSETQPAQKPIVIDLDENQEVEIDNLVVEEARSLLLAGNGSFYNGAFDLAYEAYKECVGTLMRPQRSADQVSARQILSYSDDVIQRGIVLLTSHKDLSPVEAGIQGLRSALDRRMQEKHRQQSRTEEGQKEKEDADENEDDDEHEDEDDDLLARVLFESSVIETLGDAINNCGGCKFVRGDMQAALALYQGALALRHIVDGSPSLSSAEALQNIASCYEALNKLPEAEASLKAALEMERHLGMEHTTESTSTINNLGVLYCHMKRYHSAEELLAKVVDNRTTILGSDHRLTHNAMVNLAIVRRKLLHAQHVEAPGEKDGGDGGKNETLRVPVKTPNSPLSPSPISASAAREKVKTDTQTKDM